MINGAILKLRKILENFSGRFAVPCLVPSKPINSKKNLIEFYTDLFKDLSPMFNPNKY